MKHGHPRCAARRGYTLLEVLAVATILALVAMGVTHLFSGANFERVEAGVRLMRADLELARAASLSNPADPVVMRLASDGTGYHLARVSDVATPIEGASGPMVMTFGVGRGESAAGCLIGTTSGALTVQFGPFGGVEDPVPTLRLYLLDSEEFATILLDPVTGDPTIMYENQ